jgi:transcription antitermination factor NusG
MKQETENEWYAVYTKSRCEKKVVDKLNELGIEAWIPMVRTLRQWSDRKKWVDVPLFNSYIFVRSTRVGVRKALLVDGAVYVVSFSGQPTAIPDEQIEWLKLLLASSEKFEISLDEFTFGDHVVVEKGVLRGMKGKFVNYKGKNRVLLQIEAINQNLLIDINPGFIKKENEEKVAGC